jgi:hypothetical protein
MTKIKITVSTPSFNVKKKKIRKLNSSVLSGISMARNLSDLRDVDLSNIEDKFILMYDKTDQKYKAYNPDEIFTAAAITEPTQPGLPLDFINYLAEVLQDTSLIGDLKLGTLSDVDVSGTRDKYVLMYDENTNEYRLVNPDEVLKASVVDPIQPGLPDEFLDQLDNDLDNRIDFDAGEY